MSDLIYRLYERENDTRKAVGATAPTPSAGKPSAGKVPDAKQETDEESSARRPANNLFWATSSMPDTAAKKIPEQRAAVRSIYRVEQVAPKVRGHVRNAIEFADIGIGLDAPRGQRDPAKMVDVAAPKLARTACDYQHAIDEAARRVCRDIPRICEAALNEDDPGVETWRLMVKIRFQKEYGEIASRGLAIVHTTSPVGIAAVLVAPTPIGE
jgi:hypothetical protein